MSTIDKIKGMPYNYIRNKVEGASVFVESTPVDFTMTKASGTETSSKKVEFHKAELR